MPGGERRVEGQSKTRQLDNLPQTLQVSAAGDIGISKDLVVSPTKHH